MSGRRWSAAGRCKDGRRIYDLARRLVVTVLPITAEVTDQARAIMEGHPRLMARDALHAAVCRIARAEAICSYNADLDAIAGLRRLEPPAVR